MAKNKHVNNQKSSPFRLFPLKTNQEKFSQKLEGIQV